MADVEMRRSIYVIAFAATLLLTQSVVWSVLAVAAAWSIILGAEHGWWARGAAGVAQGMVTIWAMMQRLWAGRPQPSQERTLYQVFLGTDEATGQPIIENLESIKSLVFAGTSGFGKTTWAQNFVDGLVNSHNPHEIRLAIGDVKRVSFSPWRNIPHLFCPIAKTKQEHALLVNAVYIEMERRQRLFEVYQDQFCENLDDYYRLSGTRLPRLVVLIDELADAIQPGDPAYDTLISLGKMGRFVGIHLFLGTQRPSAKILTGEIMSQIVTLLFTYMPNSREFGVVAMVPQAIYEQATPTPGRFMIYTTRGQWRFMTVRRESRDAIARRARRLSGRERRWPDVRSLPAQALANQTEWLGDDGHKVEMLRAWAQTLTARPRVKDVMDRYKLSKPTAIKYYRLAFNDDG